MFASFSSDNASLHADIPEEQALQEEIRRYQTLFENAPVGIGLATKDGKIIQCNETMLQMIGYSANEIRQINLKNTYQNPSIRAKLIKQLWKYGFIRNYETGLKRKDGTNYYANLTMRIISLNNQEIVLTIQRDITKEREIQTALQESESKYRTLLENLPQKIFLKDRNFIYVSCNENYARDFKIKPDEIAGKTDFDLFPGELAQKYRQDDKKIISSGQTLDIEEKYLKNGREQIVHTIKTPVKDKQGNITGILGIFWDITESKRIESSLREYQEKMVRAEQLASLGTLSAMLAHELAQPLTAANLFIENSLAELEEINSPDSAIKGLRDSVDELAMANSIVDRFRSFARRSLEKTICKVNLKTVVARIVQLLGESANRAKVALIVKGMDKLPSIYANEKDLEQLFFALVQNAIEASDGKKSRRLVILGQVKGRNIELEFSDNCCGIAAGNIEKIFDPFFTTKQAGKGTGLGLCISQRVVSDAGGKIRVKSKIGKGSTFFVTLPMRTIREL